MADLIIYIVCVVLFCWTGWTDRDQPFKADPKDMAGELLAKEGTNGSHD